MGRYLRRFAVILLLPFIFLLSIGWALLALIRRPKEEPEPLDLELDPLDPRGYPKGTVVEVKGGKVARVRSWNDIECHADMVSQQQKPLGLAISLDKVARRK